MQSTANFSSNFIESVHSSLISMAEIGANRLLALDQNALLGCVELQGYCITLQITDLDVEIYCHPGSWGIRLSRNPPARAVDASISGRLMALVALASTTDKISTSIQQRVSFHGDVALAQKMQKIFSALDIDWEEALAQICGDVMAFQMVKNARHVSHWLQRSADSLMQTSSEYLREEVGFSPTLPEFEQFRSQLTELKHGVARSEARLQKILRKLER